MKYLRFAALVLVILAIIAGAIHFYRESIALDIANSALREQGITATELSIETLGTDYIRLSYLILEQDDGTRYEISDLSFPLSFPSVRPESISIEKLILFPAAVDDAPLPLAQLLQTFLQLPVSVPNTEIAISRFTMPGAPPIDNIVWRSEDQQQHLEFGIEQADVTVDVTIDVDAVDDGDYEATVHAAVDSNADALSLAMTIHRTSTGFLINGTPEFNFSRWLPLLESTGLLPDELASLEVAIDGPVTLVLDDDATLPVAVTFRMSLDVGPLKIGTVSLGSANMSAALEIAIGETIEIGVSPELSLTLSDIEAQSFAVASIYTTQFSGVQLTTEDGGWRGDIDLLELAFDSLTDRENLVVSTPVTFRKLRFRNNAATFDAEISIFPNAAAISWGGSGIVAPGVKGRVSLQDDSVTASLALADQENSVAAHVDALHHLPTNKGSIAVNDARFKFDQRKLSEYTLQWPYAWDIVSGTWTTDLKVAWIVGDGQTEYSGTMTHRAAALAGNYTDYVFSGLSTTLTGNIDSAGGVRFSPASIEVELIDVGLPLKQITADFELNVEQQALRVQNLSMSVLGGTLQVDPFRFGLEEERNDLVLHPKSIQLQFMATLAELESIELTGSLSGTLPITIHNEVITIVNGRLENDPPGGVIRYLPGVSTEDVADPDSGIGLVSRALANFQFDSLTADVNYTEKGDLMLQMKLTGVNPDMDANQPVILNLGVENNIPQLLRSLRATRSIEEILERISGNQAR